MKNIFFYLLIFSFSFSKNSDWDEILNYKAYFGGIHVANATLKSKKIKLENIITIQFEASSRAVMKFIFPIKDIIEINIDPKSWQPLRVKKNLKEGDYIHNSLSNYFLNKKFYTFNNDTITYTGIIMNPYSLIYYFRNKKIKAKHEYTINIVDNKKITPLIFYVSEKEKIKSPFGTYYANKISPKRIDGKEFKNAGKITIWYSEKGKLPLMINLKLKFGSLNLELIDIN